MTAEKSGTWSRRLWTAGKVALVLALVGAAVYWFKFAPVAVEQHPVASGEVVAEVMGTGTLDAHIKATVSTKIPGRLVKVDVDQGDQVTAEQIVGRLDDHDLKHEVEIEEANVTARKAGVERLQADIVHAKATLELATANESRQRRLMAAKAVAQEEYDRTVGGPRRCSGRSIPCRGGSGRGARSNCWPRKRPWSSATPDWRMPSSRPRSRGL